MCWDFKKGTCKKGSLCPWAHEEPGMPKSSQSLMDIALSSSTEGQFVDFETGERNAKKASKLNAPDQHAKPSGSNDVTSSLAKGDLEEQFKEFQDFLLNDT
eukprot:TRINITY_DN42351_c0_g1_i1.p1 TRINITY_DN42351_c0_g1~~TRINITY_DN42351_c0_g1_i1.p1  ORF type:complete len:101 (-),score=22.73 TRINITY_DN42351_c0_g1_i1:110-412(-)